MPACKLLASLIDDRSSADLFRLNVLIHADERDATKPYMRSGLYFVALPGNSSIVFFWPEQTTWDRSAIRNVVSNRVTFMR